MLWFACFALADPMDEAWFLVGALIMALANAYVMLRNESLDKFQDILFKVCINWMGVDSSIYSPVKC